ncbi:MAG: PIN domain-containing protein [Bifidobacteriaceae bacterium]|jgi:predicted nucleic acid-binding protein|nr:PIN domain-containing protein [Bifidobacteriaceae bacterium]
MLYYVDTSVIGHAILPDGDPRAASWATAVQAGGSELVSSRLLRLELTRLVRRLGLDLALVDQAVSRVNLVDIDPPVLRQAEGIQHHVKSLDAIHLGTALSVDPTLTLVSHDTVMLLGARTLGLRAFDPLEAALDSQPEGSQTDSREKQGDRQPDRPG